MNFLKVVAAQRAASPVEPVSKRRNTKSNDTAGEQSVPVPSVDGPSARDAMVKQVAEVTQELEAVFAAYVAGKHDAHRGKFMTQLMKEITEAVTRASKLLKACDDSQEKRCLGKIIGKIESAKALLKVCAKPSATYFEIAGACDTLRTAGGTVSPGHSKMQVCQHVDHLVVMDDASKIIDLLLDESGSNHGVGFISDPVQKLAVASAILIKYVTAAFPIKLASGTTMQQAEATARERMEPLFKIIMNHNDQQWVLDENSRRHLATISCIMQPDAADSKALQKTT